MAYEWTQVKYWKKPNLSYSILKLLTIFLGFFGIDHLYMRSPLTALLKFIVNICTFGFVWFHDMITVFTEEKLVKKYGMYTPVFTTAGIGAGMFPEDDSQIDGKHSPWMFVGYSLLTFIAFGFNNFLVGDTIGGAFKFICTIIPLFWFIMIPLYLHNIYVLLFDTESIFSAGIPTMGGRIVYESLSPDGVQPTASYGFFISLTISVLRTLSYIPIVGPIFGGALASIEKTMATITGVIDTTKKMSKAGQQAVETITKTIPQAATQVPEQMQAGLLAKVPGPPAMPAVPDYPMHTKPGIGAMTGGGLTDTGYAGTALMGVLYAGIILAIGNYIYKRRKETKEDSPPEAFRSTSGSTDVPPPYGKEDTS